jgi:hypothetical protein
LRREEIEARGKNKNKGKRQEEIHHLGAKLKLGLEILGARGKRVRIQP